MNKEDYFKYYIQGSDHYLIPKDVFDELFNEMSNWREEAKELNQKYLNAVADYETTMSELQELRKQLENCFCNRTDCAGRIKDSKQYDSLVQKVENQQKEFIDWLEENYKNTQDIWYIKILNKYKEIIGDDK